MVAASKNRLRAWAQHPTSTRAHPSGAGSDLSNSLLSIEDVVDVLRVRLDVVRVAPKHLHHVRARLARRVVEEHVIAVRNHHEEVALLA